MQQINAKAVEQSLVSFIQTSFKRAGFTKAVIAVSGGVDSVISVTLATKALGKENIFSLLLPYGNLNQQGVRDGRLVLDWLQIPRKNIQEINIQAFVDPIVAFDPAMDQVRRGNIMARARMIVVCDHAKKRNALVIGTENRTEHLLGYYTRFGDEASDIEPLRNLYKTQVYQLARHLDVPEPILAKKPTAGLWEGQTDEGEFGFTYKEADEILSLFYDEKHAIKEIIASGISKELVDRVNARMEVNAFKHTLPIVHLQEKVQS